MENGSPKCTIPALFEKRAGIVKETVSTTGSTITVPTGFEPAIFCVTGRHVRPLHHGTNIKTITESGKTQMGKEGLEPPVGTV